MEAIKANAILQFNQNQLQNVRKALEYEDVNKLKQEIELLKDWISKQTHFIVKEFYPNYLERLLIYNKGSIERTKQRMDKLFTCTNLMPEFLKNFDVKNEFESLLKVLPIGVMPKPTEDNYRILVTRFTGVDDDNFSVLQLYRYLMVEAMGQRLKNIHLVNNSKWFDALMILTKQTLSAKLQKRLVVHKTPEGLHEEFPRKNLPQEFGGDDKSMSVINDINFKEFCSDKSIETLKFMEEVATDESCRLSSAFNEEYSGMPGSFKTLCVD